MLSVGFDDANRVEILLNKKMNILENLSRSADRQRRSESHSGQASGAEPAQEPVVFRLAAHSRRGAVAVAGTYR